MRSDSAHAPTSDEPEVRQAFFDTHLIKFTVVNRPVFLGLDANGRLDSLELGSGDTKRIRDAASQLRTFITDAQLCTTYDMPAFRHATANTWTANKAGALPHTIDYVLFSSNLRSSVVKAYTCSHIDNTHVAQDHWPTLAIFKVDMTKPLRGPSAFQRIPAARLTSVKVPSPLF